ncbi:hypothetical protein XHC_0478 [Xanthomonas hortorum pv. carotae str. M081]|nr:hypothetical protein XHC_0478 [Xanthomonas hortorum pv. carotae str. M081]
MKSSGGTRGYCSATAGLGQQGRCRRCANCESELGRVLLGVAFQAE